jgi:uncharacterized phage protein (TIGR01671 family)
MEDRYLFKAKRVDNGKWVIGYYGVIGKRNVIIEKYAENYYCPDTCESRHGNQIHEVNSKTICQCTGLKDKNGKLIWENDIVKINNSKGNVLITFRDFEIICTIPNEKYYKHRLEYDTEYEVVGNVFDNPELLESEG